MDAKYSPQQPHQDELDREQLAEFAGLFEGLRRIEYPAHPSEAILRAYIANRLADSPEAGRVGATFRDARAFQGFLQGRVPYWTRSDVAIHVLTCTRCQERVAYLRARRWQLLGSARQVSTTGTRSWWRRFAWGALGAAVAAVILAALWLWPSSPLSPACWIEERCWSEIIQESPTKGSVMVVYRRGRF
ncbi:MAG: hypothetical protein NZ930_06360 [Candidatus Bipolaricaulota bacterium]|nr:hypothetical protein [Candidatus Bipolaricaulota bacterium]MDW8030296.1 hypothetical protein [Candidatus Bipolaricaulota bacterium]